MPTYASRHDILARARQVKLLALDVDGVLTDGQLYFTNSGEEMKSFSTLDGQGIKLLQDSGVAVALITARSSQLVSNRAANLGIRHLVQGSHDKLQALQQLQAQLGIAMNETAYVGDDLPDLASIRRVGLGITVPNGHAAIQEQAFCITTAAGGRGAVREVCDWIMQAQNSYEAAIARFS
jgi:3-deoxy-D-manno-octulosonate 8-phosphate phosphatase (KDO 8-P phosphatase)